MAEDKPIPTSGLVSQARRRLVASRSVSHASRPRLVVCGDDPLAYRLVEALAVQYGRQVTVILPSKRRNHGPDIVRLAGVRVVEADKLDAEAFSRAEVGEAAAVALVAQDDVGNLHAALLAQEINVELRLVIRMFNGSLRHSVRTLVPRCVVLSDAAIAAPAVVAATLGEVAPTFVRLPGRTLLVARRGEVSRQQVIAGLAETSTDGPAVLLPSDQDRCDVVLALADGVNRPNWARPGRLSALWRRLTHSLGQTRFLFNGSLRIAALALVMMVLAGTLMLNLADSDLSVWQAFYLTVLDAVGGANPDPGAPGAIQIIQVMVMVAGIAMVPVVTAAIVDTVVKARLAMATGRLRTPFADHVVVVGLGNVGTRVIQQLRDLGIAVVAVDRTDHARGARTARELGVPLVVGDASQVETLYEANVERARALAVVSTDDVTNLEAALHARTLKKDLRVVLRLFDGDFARRVQRAFHITASTSVSLLAVPEFTAAMLGSEVIGTIPIDRAVLVVAEVRVRPGSSLAGGTVGGAGRPGAARVIAVTAGEYRDLCWATDPHRPISAGDRLVVVATRQGLSRLQAEAAAATEPVAAPGG